VLSSSLNLTSISQEGASPCTPKTFSSTPKNYLKILSLPPVKVKEETIFSHAPPAHPKNTHPPPAPKINTQTLHTF